MRIEDDNSLRNIPVNKEFICMYSGGKDSGLALSMAKKVSKATALIYSLEEKKSDHQTMKFVEAQASHMNMPITFIKDSWTDLIKIFRQYKLKGVDFVVFGDLLSEKNVNRHATLCKSAGLIPCFPLWRLPYDQLVEKMTEHNLTSIISSINSESIDSKWLGQEFDITSYTQLKKLGIDPLGENGEFHTTMVNSDVFIKTLKYSMSIDYDKKHVNFTVEE